MDVFLFDLDGTLADSIGDIVECANLVRGTYGLAPLPEKVIWGFIGKGSRWLVARTLTAKVPENGADLTASLSDDEEMQMPPDSLLIEAVRRWVELYEQHMMDRTRLFPGIREALTALSGPKAIVTNKPAESAREIHRIG